jgi:thioredoxin reductase
MSRTDPPRIAILGAGPIGLEAALYAATLQLPVAVHERGQVGAHLRQWGHVRLFSPFGMNRTSLGVAAIRHETPKHEFPGDQDCISGHEHLKAYLEPLAQVAPLRECIHFAEEVLHIGRRGLLKTDSPGDPKRGQQPFLLLIRDAQGKERIEEADVVLDCSGTYGRHRWMGEGGLPAAGEKQAASSIAYGLEDVRGERRKTYAGRNILVVGGGYSAASTIRDLAKLAEEESATWVVWAARCTSSQPIRRVVNDPLPERDRLAQRANMLATRPEGNVEFRNQIVIESLEPIQGGVRVTGRAGSKKTTWEVERVIANVGYAPDDDLFRELQVHQCYATQGPMGLAAALLKQGGADCLAVAPQGASVLKTTEPGFFILGAKSYGRNSQFLMRKGFEQVREVFAFLTGKNGLDLYKNR